MSSEVRREVVFASSPDEVWEALTDADRLAEWFANEVELDPRPGGQGIFRWADGAERHAVVEEAEAPRRFAFEWADPGEAATTSVEFTLEDIPEGTRLIVVESAPAGPRACMGEWAWAAGLQALAGRVRA